MEKLAIMDIETKDPNLKKWGPGSIRKDGYIIGVGILLMPEKTIRFYKPEDSKVQEVLKDSTRTKVFHNGVYDLDWLVNGYGYELQGRVEDTMTRETLLDTYALSYSLDACCQRRGVQGKNKSQTIDAWYASHGGKGKAIENLDKIPFDIVGEYCLQDLRATYYLYEAQQPLLEEQNLLHANDIEVRLYPVLLNMRKNGFRIDLNKCIEMGNQLMQEYEDGIAHIEKTYGFPEGTFSINSAKDLEKIWKKEHLPITYTGTGKPSFAADVLDDCDHEISTLIKHLRGILRTTAFLDGWIDIAIKDKIHPVMYPAKRDNGGTVTGRWSCQNPNLQQAPAREDKYGKEIRSLFIPENNCLLGAFDYKQIEYRVFTHFAVGPGAEAAQKRYWEDSDTDYHQMTIDLMDWNDLGKEGRHLAKNLNFGSIYGLGPKSFSVKFKHNLLHNHPERDPDNLYPVACSLMDEYFRKVPFVKPTCNKIMDVGQKRGYVKTLSGKRQRMPLDNGTYKLINYLIQGSAADILKKGIVDAWERGVFNVLTLHVLVHDEVVFSIPQTPEGLKACELLYECMCNAYQLKIPISVDTEIGEDWGHCTEDKWNQFKEAQSAV